MILLIPAIITILSIVWVIWMNTGNDSAGRLYIGVCYISCMVPALFVDMMAWMIAAVLK